MISQFDNSLNLESILWKTNEDMYIKPAPILNSFISYYSISFPKYGLISKEYSLIPDGSGTITVYIDRNGFNTNLWGATTEIKYLEDTVNEIEFLLLIELKNEGLFQLLKINQREITNRIMLLEEINNKLVQNLINLMEKSNNISDLVAGLNHIFYELLWGDKRSYFKVNGVLQRIVKNKGLISSNELEQSECYSYRHLNRLFQQQVGMSIKTFGKIVRVNHSVTQMKSGKYTLTEIANSCGYYDQSHFIKEFKSVCNILPSDYLKYTSRFYNETLKY